MRGKKTALNKGRVANESLPRTASIPLLSEEKLKELQKHVSDRIEFLVFPSHPFGILDYFVVPEGQDSIVYQDVYKPDEDEDYPLLNEHQTHSFSFTSYTPDAKTELVNKRGEFIYEKRAIHSSKSKEHYPRNAFQLKIIFQRSDELSPDPVMTIIESSREEIVAPDGTIAVEGPWMRVGKSRTTYSNNRVWDNGRIIMHQQAPKEHSLSSLINHNKNFNREGFVIHRAIFKLWKNKAIEEYINTNQELTQVKSRRASPFVK